MQTTSLLKTTGMTGFNYMLGLESRTASQACIALNDIALLCFCVLLSLLL